MAKSSRKNSKELPKPSIRRLAIRGNAKRVKGDVYKAYNEALMDDYLKKVLLKASLYADSTGRKTLNAEDILNALSVESSTAF
jgi:histone H3/H4